MSNSSLVDYVKLSPNYNPRNGKKILKITPHHAAGVVTVEGIGSIFANKSRQASSNYSIGYDGRIGMHVEEHNRAWTSSSAENDYVAVTIEVSNSATGGDWPVSDLVLNRLVDLCVDICKRNGIDKLEFTGDKNGNLTMHKMFAATACPGPYLESKFPWLAAEVNKRLNEEFEMSEECKKLIDSLGAKVTKLEKEVDRIKIKYNWTTACPEYAQSTVHKLHQKELLKGNNKGELELTEPMIRMLVILDRAGMFD